MKSDGNSEGRREDAENKANEGNVKSEKESFLCLSGLQEDPWNDTNASSAPNKKRRAIGSLAWLAVD